MKKIIPPYVISTTAKVLFQASSYLIAVMIPYFMVTAKPGSLNHLFYFPFFSIPILTLLYFSDPLSALYLLIFSAMIGTCGLIFTMTDFNWEVPSPLIFLVQIGWLGVLFWRAEKLIEKKNLRIHRMQEKIEKLELALLTAQYKEGNLERSSRGIKERIAHYSYLRSFIDQIASSLEVGEIQGKTESTLKQLFAGREELFAQVNYFSSPEAAEKSDKISRWLVAHRIPLLVEDYSRDPRFDSIPTTQQTHSIIACPIERENCVVGTLRVESPLLKKWKEEDLRFLSDIANIVSLAMSSAFYYQEIKSLAERDSLTNSYVRYRFDERIEEEFSRSKESSLPLSLILLDIDHFKQVNDLRGHLIGDLALKLVSQVITAQTRETDFCARYGGDEFAVIMPLTTLENSYQIAKRMRKNIAESLIGPEKTGITISGGVACVVPSQKNVQELIQSADRALYLAKEKGGDQIIRSMAKF